MAKSLLRFQKTLAALLPLMFIWVSVACLSICMGCEAPEAAGASLLSESPTACGAACAAECEGDSGGAPSVASPGERFCPIPDTPDGALHRNYAYETKANGGGHALPASGLVSAFVVTSQAPSSFTSTVILKPPLERFGVLRI